MNRKYIYIMEYGFSVYSMIIVKETANLIIIFSFTQNFFFFNTIVSVLLKLGCLAMFIPNGVLKL